MNKKSATKQGLRFTGHYERTWSEIDLKLKAKELRKELKCRVVCVDGDGGISLYADQRYFDIDKLKSAKVYISGLPGRISRLKAQFEADMAVVRSDEAYTEKLVSDIITKHPDLG